MIYHLLLIEYITYINKLIGDQPITSHRMRNYYRDVFKKLITI